MERITTRAPLSKVAKAVEDALHDPDPFKRAEARVFLSYCDMETVLIAARQGD